MDQVTAWPWSAPSMGIIFIDEIDKVAGAIRPWPTSRAKACSATFCHYRRHHRQYALRMIRTDHILFIAAGAFHVTKPSDLIPELQGRLPSRGAAIAQEEDFIRI